MATIKYKKTDDKGNELVYRSPFWKWLRQNPLFDSSKGFRCTDIDGIWRNNSTGKFILLEHKCRLVMPSWCQTETLMLLDNSLNITNPNYNGCFLLLHQGESTSDGYSNIYKLNNGQWVSKLNSDYSPKQYDEKLIEAFFERAVK
jgi:hypothetical protein